VTRADTPLHVAIQNESVSCTRLLIERKADVNHVNAEDMSALELANQLAVFPREVLLIKQAVLVGTRPAVPLDDHSLSEENTRRLSSPRFNLVAGSTSSAGGLHGAGEASTTSHLSVPALTPSKSSLQEWIIGRKRSVSVGADGEQINAFRFTTPYDPPDTSRKKRPIPTAVTRVLVLVPGKGDTTPTTASDSSRHVALHETLACQWFVPKRVRFNVSKARSMCLPPHAPNTTPSGASAESAPMQLSLGGSGIIVGDLQSSPPSATSTIAAASAPTPVITIPSASPSTSPTPSSPISTSPALSPAPAATTTLGTSPGSPEVARKSLSPTMSRLRKKAERILGGASVPFKDVPPFPSFSFAVPIDASAASSTNGSGSATSSTSTSTSSTSSNAINTAASSEYGWQIQYPQCGTKLQLREFYSSIEYHRYDSMYYAENMYNQGSLRARCSVRRTH